MKVVLVVCLAGAAFLGTILLVGLAFMDIYMIGFSFLEPEYDGSHDVFGIYLTDEGSAKIQIEDCGDGTPCGRFVWFDANALPHNETMETFSGVDGNPLLGSLILKGFTRERTDWRGGTIFDSDNIKTYFAHLKRMPDGSLRVRGCLGPFCHTQIWSNIAVPIDVLSR
jgi:uncharacterized protein (DUF2147 family)